MFFQAYEQEIKYTLHMQPRAFEEMTRKNLKIAKRGKLAPGYFADVVVFDPKTIADKNRSRDFILKNIQNVYLTHFLNI